MKSGSKTISRFRGPLAFALILWCAGTGCMIVSYARAEVNKAVLHGTDHDMRESANSMNGQACGKSKRQSAKQSHARILRGHEKSRAVNADFKRITSSTQCPSRAMSCCPLITG